MLNSNALNQLSELKQTIRASKNYAEGVVRGTSGRFGFVVLDDDREAFLNPEQMQRVLPGDRVEVTLTQNDKGQWEANLEKLIKTEFREFVGQYLVKGKGHFVVPDAQGFHRWVFLPPKQRKNAKEKDFILCRITRHPFEDGKGQAQVIRRIGAPNDPYIERNYTVGKFLLRDHWPAALQDEIAKTQAQPQQLDNGIERRDLSALPLVTIDSATTKDMDDALFAQAADDGWHLTVAIADPTAGVDFNSGLGRAAWMRGQTVYLPGGSCSMLPTALSHNHYSLVPDENRPALACTLHITAEGEIKNAEFFSATVRSHAKLNYTEVSDFLTDATPMPSLNAHEDVVTHSLKALADIAKARKRYRKKHALIMDERADYDYQINAQGKLDNVVKQSRNTAHRLVEEAMLATNISAGEWLMSKQLPGLFSAHKGFRSERLSIVQKLIKEDMGKEVEALDTLEGYRSFMQELQQQEEHSTLFSLLKRQLQAGALSLTAEPHLGLGFAAYATMTSPIRRIQDFYNHQLIKSHLNGSAAAEITDEKVAQLSERLNNGRQACRQLEQWLMCDFLAGKEGQAFTATITMVNSQGVGVKLDENGAEAFCLLRDKNKKKQKNLSFNPERLTLTFNELPLRLDDSVTVILKKVDKQQRQLSAQLVLPEPETETASDSSNSAAADTATQPQVGEEHTNTDNISAEAAGSAAASES